MWSLVDKGLTKGGASIRNNTVYYFYLLNSNTKLMYAC